jgi:phosphoribosyl 1,2-cyclic phosphodiesterase
MPLFIASLNSGSNGNCYYIGNSSEAVLIDAGVSCREIEKRMKKINLSLQMVKAVFVSHEHSDHITGVPGLSKKYQLPVYITPSTLASSEIVIQQHLVHTFQTDQAIAIGKLTVRPFTKFHDASDPHSFLVSGDNIHVGVFTDLGHSCQQVTKNFSQCHAAFLESNYSEEMLMSGNYPAMLKKRISGDDGHLSNDQALALFTKHRGKQLSHLILSHLSKNNNKVALVKKLFAQQAGNTKIIVASRYKETPVFCINDSSRAVIKRIKKTSEAQLSLF